MEPPGTPRRLFSFSGRSSRPGLGCDPWARWRQPLAGLAPGLILSGRCCSVVPAQSGLSSPALPSPAKAPPTGPDWRHEIKHDGFRILALRDAAGVQL